MSPTATKETKPEFARRAVPIACASCGVASLLQIQIANVATGQHVTVCPRCLRSALRLKADLSETRSRNVLQEYAEEMGCSVWMGQAALYLLPTEGPFAPALVTA